MYPIPKSIEPHIDEPHVIGLFIGDEQEPALSSLDDLASCVYNARFCGGGLSIGALCSANVSISAYGQHDLSGRDIIVKLGFGDPLEWLQLGAFRVCECHVGDDTTSITAYDAAYWATGGEYTPTVQTPTSVRAVLEDVCEQCNITLGDLPATADRVIDGRLTGYTARQIIMHMAAVCGCNALIDRSGALRLKWISDNGQSIGPDEYYADELTNSTTINIVGVQMKTKITTPSTDPDTGITVEREEEKTYSSASGTGRVLAVDCPYANQELVDAIADAIVPLSYTAGSVSFIGGYDIEPGDILTITALSGAVHSVPVLALTLSLDGGCRAAVTAGGYSDTDTDAKFDSEYQQALKRIEADIIAAKNLTAENFEAQTAYIQSLSADEAFVDKLFSNNIKAEQISITAQTTDPDTGGEYTYSFYTGYKDDLPSIVLSTDFSATGDAQSSIAVSPELVTINANGVKFTSPKRVAGDPYLKWGIGGLTINDSSLFVSGTISEGGTKLEDKYVGIYSGTAAGGDSHYASSVVNQDGYNLLMRFGGSWISEEIRTVGAQAAKLQHRTYYGSNGWNGWSTIIDSNGGTINGSLSVTSSISTPVIYVENVSSLATYSRTTTLGANVRIGDNGQFFRSTSSSRRYKTDIADLPIDDIRGLYHLPVRSFRYKIDYTPETDERHGKKIPGFIAEELEKVLPIAVDHVDGTAEMWNSNIMVPCLLRLVQNLNERVETLEKRLEALERKEDCK